MGKEVSPDIDPGMLSTVNNKGEAKNKPDLSQFSFPTGTDYGNNCSEWMDGAAFMSDKKVKGQPAVYLDEMKKIMKEKNEEFSLALVSTPINSK